MAQDYAVKTPTVQSPTLRLALMGMLSAISLVLILYVRIPLIPAASWLVYDMADIPIMLGAFTLGPGAGMLILTVVSLIQAFMLDGNGPIGFIMHMASSGVLVVVASLLFRKLGDTNKSLALSLITSALTMVVAMIGLNLIFTPILFGMPVEAVVELIVPVLLPFNLIKTTANAGIFFVLYKSLRVVLPKYLKA